MDDVVCRFVLTVCIIRRRDEEIKRNPVGNGLRTDEKKWIFIFGFPLTNHPDRAIITPVGGTSPGMRSDMRKWRNWQTRTFEGRVEYSVRVQVPSSAFFYLFRSFFRITENRIFPYAKRKIRFLFWPIWENPGGSYRSRCSAHFRTHSDQRGSASISRRTFS